MDIVVAYCEAWDTPLRTSKHHYIERLAKAGHRILYVEAPMTPLSILRRPGEFAGKAARSLWCRAVPAEENIWTLTGVFPLPFHAGMGGLFDKPGLNNINQKTFIRRLRKAMNDLGFEKPVVLSYLPFLLPVLEKVEPSRVILHMIDEWQGMPGIPRSMAAMTEGLLKQADMTVVSSATLYDRYKETARAIHLLRHGTDLGLFGPVVTGEVTPAQELSGIEGVKVGYYGALHKLDYDLVTEVAQARPDWTFIFIGPLGGAQGLGTDARLPENVLLWNFWKRGKLASFLAGLDAFWMPFQQNDLTNAMCPIKLFEVLSAGIATVSSDLAETREVGGEHVGYANTAIEHLAALDEAISDNEASARKERAASVSSYDWSERVKEFSELLFGR